MSGCASSLQPPASGLRPAFTLIEMLVSLAITLIMMGAVVSLFGVISDNVSHSRSIIEISERLRAARNRLQADLVGATATMAEPAPPLRPESDAGYFEYIEGPMHDYQYLMTTSLGNTNYGPSATALGDVDDVLMFTVRSRGEPFVGRYTNSSNVTTSVESQAAEVMYFCAQDPTGVGGTLYINPSAGQPVKLYTLYRRVLLVLPGLINSATFPAPSQNYYDDNDISARITTNASGSPILVPNTLGDLTKRENRYAHLMNNTGGVAFQFPYDVTAKAPSTYQLTNTTPSGTLQYTKGALAPMPPVPSSVTGTSRFGDDVLLTNVLSFDVQIYDPDAPLRLSGGAAPHAALTPSDPGYRAGTNIPYGSDMVRGTYVDLGWGQSVPNIPNNPPNNPPPQFYFNKRNPVTVKSNSNPIHLVPGLNSLGTGLWFTYDTWSLHYESNGVDDDNYLGIDQGTNGINNDATVDSVVDDPDEMETHAPFSAPIRGIKVTIRVYEPGSQQIRQVTVVEDFLPE